MVFALAVVYGGLLGFCLGFVIGRLS